MKKGVMYTFGASIILIICFIAFVLPSSLSKTSQKQEGLVFGKWNGKKISYEYGSDFTEFLSQYAQMFRNQGQEITSSNQYTIYQYAFSSTVIKFAQEEALKKAGYEVPQESINLQLKNYFKDSDGKFDLKAYKQADPSYIESLTKSMKNYLYTGRYTDDCFGTTYGDYTLFGLKSPKAETEFLESFGKEKRAFKMVTFDTVDYPKEEQLKYGKANTEKFVKYDMTIITVDDLESANKVLSRITKGQITFDDAVAEYSEKNYSESDGTLTNNSQYQIQNILEDADDLSKVINLAEGEVSAPLKTMLGYTIFRNNASPIQPDFSTEDTLKDIQNYISIYENSVIEDYYVEVANKFIKEAKASDIDSVIANYPNTTVEDLAAFPLNYGSNSIYEAMDTNTIKVLANADKDENFLKQAFSVKLNDYTDPIIIGGDIVVLQYTGSETVEKAEDAEPSNFSSQLVDFDQNAMQQSVFQNPKLENQFLDVYIKNFTGSSY